MHPLLLSRTVDADPVENSNAASPLASNVIPDVNPIDSKAAYSAANDGVRRKLKLRRKKVVPKLPLFHGPSLAVPTPRAGFKQWSRPTTEAYTTTTTTAEPLSALNRTEEEKRCEWMTVTELDHVHNIQ